MVTEAERSAARLILPELIERVKCPLLLEKSQEGIPELHNGVSGDALRELLVGIAVVLLSYRHFGYQEQVLCV